MRMFITVFTTFLISISAQAAEMASNAYREPLRNSIAGKPAGILNPGARLQILEQQGDWVRVSVEGWMRKSALKTLPQPVTDSASAQNLSALNPAGLLTPKLLKKGYSAESLNEIIWLDVEFDTTGLPKKTRAIKGALVISDLFGDIMMRIYWTINEPLEPGQDYSEKGTNFAYNEFLSHHQWVRYTKHQDMKVSFLVSDIIFDDGEQVSWRH